MKITDCLFSIQLKAVKEMNQVPKPAAIIKEMSYIDFSR